MAHIMTSVQNPTKFVEGRAKHKWGVQEHVYI